MNDRLNRGHRFDVADGGTLVVDDFLGAGGQGDVYRVKTSSGDRALKWYFAGTATDGQRHNLKRLVELGHDDERFLWPELFVADLNSSRFGYVMRLRPGGWADIPMLLRRKAQGATVRTLYAMGVGMAEAFRSLHTRGLAYRDISWGNVFFEPRLGAGADLRQRQRRIRGRGRGDCRNDEVHGPRAATGRRSPER